MIRIPLTERVHDDEVMRKRKTKNIPCTQNQKQIAKVSCILNEKGRLGDFSPNSEYRRLEGTMTELGSVGLVKGLKLLSSQGIAYCGDHP